MTLDTARTGNEQSGGDSPIVTLSELQQGQKPKKEPKGATKVKGNKSLFDAFEEEMSKPELHEKIAACFPRALRNDEDGGISRARNWAAAVARMSRNNVEICRCSIKSVTGALRLCAQMGLEPGPLDLVHMIPGLNTEFGEYELNIRIGYRGYLELMRRTGQVGDIDSVIVYERDTFSLRKKSVVAAGRLMYIWDLEHIPFIGDDRGDKLHVYATVNFLNADAHIEMMTGSDVDKIKQMTNQRDGEGNIIGPWVEHEDEMWRVTAIRRLRKWVPLSQEMQLAETVNNLLDIGERQRLDGFSEGKIDSLVTNYQVDNSKRIEAGYSRTKNGNQMKMFTD